MLSENCILHAVKNCYMMGVNRDMDEDPMGKTVQFNGNKWYYFSLVNMDDIRCNDDINT